jgi:hypothetical protein
MTGKRIHHCTWITVVLLGLAVVRPAAGQGHAEPRYAELVGWLKRDYLSAGLLLQAVSDFQIDRTVIGNNGFSVANFRILLTGELDRRFGYLLQTNFILAPSILDAMMYYRASPAIRLDVGQFKAPFSYEFLTYAGSIDFVNRAQAVTLISPKRQLGLQVLLGQADAALRFGGGVFNGNGSQPLGNDNNHLLYAGRVFGSQPLSEGNAAGSGNITYGFNAAYSKDDGAALLGRIVDFTGTRTLLGADVRVEAGPYLLSTEWLYGRFDAVDADVRHAWGGHATIGYRIKPSLQLLGRLDLFAPGADEERSDLIVLGLNFWPTSVTEIQANYIVDTSYGALNHHQLLVNFQFGF